jgi:hypothetical protein
VNNLFADLTIRLHQEKRVSGFFMQAPARAATAHEKRVLDTAFDGKTAMKGHGRQLAWGDWLVESLFPTHFYALHNRSLRRLVADESLWETYGFSGNDNNSFCRMARPRPDLPEGFVNFMLDRLKGKYGGTPLFYFDVEQPEWVCAPLSGRPDIPKTGRTSVSCVMNYGFHNLAGTLSISIILRHMNWSHSWGDVYGGHAALKAVCDETGLKMGSVSIFANSASMDEPKAAKTYIKYMIGE